MRKYLLLMFLLFIPIVNAVDYTIIQRNITGYSAVSFDNKIYISLYRNWENETILPKIFENDSLIYYDLGTGNFVSYDNMLGSGKPIPQIKDSRYIVNTEKNFFYGSSGNQFFVSSEPSTWRVSGAGTKPSTLAVNLTIYKRDTINNAWTSIFNWSYDGGNNFWYSKKFYGMAIYSTTTGGSRPQYNLFGAGALFGIGATSGANTQAFIYNVTTGQISVGTWNINSVLPSETPCDSSTSIGDDCYRYPLVYRVNKYTNARTNIYTENATMLDTGVFVNNNAKNAVNGSTGFIFDYDTYNWHKAYIVNARQNKLYVVNNLTNWTNGLVDTASDSSCNTIYGLTGLKIEDIDCKDDTDCMIVGNINAGKGLMFAFNGEQCRYVDLTPDNIGTLYSVAYNELTGNYYAVGNGTVISYLNTFSNGTPQVNNGSLCLDRNYLCTNPIFQNDQSWYCNIDDLAYCNMGCDTYHNQCNPSSITNECNIYGENQCVGVTGLHTCGNYDTDAALEFGPTTLCIYGSSCSGGQCIASTALHAVSYPSFSIIPDLTTTYFLSTGTVTTDPTVLFGYPGTYYTQSYSYNTATNTVTINGGKTNNTLSASITTSGPSVYAYDCNYNETTLYTNAGASYLTDSSITLPLTTDNNRINFTLGIDTYANISIMDSGNNPIAYIALQYNSTMNTTCIYVLNDTTVGTCEPQLPLNRQSKRIGFEIDLASKFFAISYERDRYSRIPFITQSSTDVNSIKIGTTNATLYNISYTRVRDFPSYNNMPLAGSSNNIGVSIGGIFLGDATIFSFNSEKPINCGYRAEGCYKIRTYVASNNTDPYQNFKDLNVCSQGLTVPTQIGTSTNATGGSGFNAQLTTDTKLAMAIIITLILSLFVTFAIYLPTQSRGLATGVFIAVSISCIAFFTIKGWIDAGIIIMIGIICALAIFILFKFLFINPSSRE